jgi:hypothetical protein
MTNPGPFSVASLSRRFKLSGFLQSPRRSDVAIDSSYFSQSFFSLFEPYLQRKSNLMTYKLVAKILFALTLAFGFAEAHATTWYVRKDGGTRYSTNQLSGQCNGKADVAYPGAGVNQACAFNDARFLWQDGSYTYGKAFPGWGWVGAGGDTYIVRGSIADGVSYRVGWDSPTSYCTGTTCFGVTGDPYGSGAPPIPSGTAAQHTTFEGGQFASCHTASARTQLHGGYGVSSVLQMVGSSYVDVSCFDITDFSSCGRAGQANGCNTSLGTQSDYATSGISWSNSSTHDSLTDVRVHGMAATGMIGPTGDQDTFSYLDLVGNPSSGWNADAGDGKTGTGALLVQNFNISWNGCAEEYPISDALPYQDCTDDNSGGYGDGFGTATVASSPGWAATFMNGTASFNTQDGLDALHLTGAGSSMTIYNVSAFSNMGQQMKIGGSKGSVMSSTIYTNCNAMRSPMTGLPSGYNAKLSDFCRAADTGVLISVGNGATTTYKGNTIYSASATAIEVAAQSACTDGTCILDFVGNTFIGYLNNTANGYPGGGTGDYSNPIYLDGGVSVFTSPGTLFSGNTTFHPKSNWPCPNVAWGETGATCTDPALPDEGWHKYGTAVPPTTTTGSTGSTGSTTSTTGGTSTTTPVITPPVAKCSTFTVPASEGSLSLTFCPK